MKIEPLENFSLYSMYYSVTLILLSEFLPCHQLLIVMYLGSGHHGSVHLCPPSSSYTRGLDHYSE